MKLPISSQCGATDLGAQMWPLGTVSMLTASDTLATPEQRAFGHTHFVAPKGAPGSFPKFFLLWAWNQPAISLKGPGCILRRMV